MQKCVALCWFKKVDKQKKWKFLKDLWNTDKGQAVVNIYPAMCIVDNKLITGVQFMSNFYLGRGSKFLYVFSDSSLSNVKN